MTTLLIALQDALMVAYGRRTGPYEVEFKLPRTQPRCLAADPLRPEHLYCGNFGQGLWRSHDRGATWQPAAEGITHDKVTAVAVSPVERAGPYGLVYAGTEPSTIFCSQDGGQTWQERPGLADLPSATTWHFPPRPYTHHVRCILPDPVVSGRLFICIEAGALIRSHDGGQTWEERILGGPRDTHTLVTHPSAPGRLYAAAGDGYFQSSDAGVVWHQPDDGLRHHYLWSLAVDPADAETILVSAAGSPRQAHDVETAESFIYRRTAGEPWQPARTGLPQPEGTTISTVVSGAEPGLFYAANNHGVYRSADAGLAWERLDIPWQPSYRSQRIQDLVVIEAD